MIPIQTKGKIFKKDPKLPSLEELGDEFELHIVEKKSGKKISSLSEIEELKLSINAQKKEEWERIFNSLKKFSKKQLKELKKRIQEKGKSIPKKEIYSLINQINRKPAQNIQKVPVNLFNVLLTNKEQTLNKIGKIHFCSFKIILK